MPLLSTKLRYLLFPLALFYWGALFWRNFFYVIGFFVVRRLPVTVVSVGNLSVGGTGKTPAVIYLARMLQEKQLKVAVVSRGYSRESSGTLLVSDGKQVNTSWRQCGDEPYFMAKRLPGVAVVVDEVRYRGGMYALRKFKPDVVVLDDGFQHRALSRDVDIVLLNSQDPPQTYKLLPYGKLREPWFHLRRADIVFWTKSNLGRPHSSIRTRVLESKVPAFPSRVQANPVLRGRGESTLRTSQLKEKKVFAFCGIADPVSFQRLLEELGVDLVGFEVFEDHHDYSMEDVSRMMDDGTRIGADLYVTTDKDFFKVAEMIAEEVELYSLGIDFVPSQEGGVALMEMILVKTGRWGKRKSGDPTPPNPLQ